MRVEKDILVPLGYGKYFRSQSIVGLEPIEENRGPGRRTWVYVEGIEGPVIASRSQGAIMRDMVDVPKEVIRVQEQRQLLGDILDTVLQIDPVLRNIVRDQGSWNLDRLEERIKELISGDEPE